MRRRWLATAVVVLCLALAGRIAARHFPTERLVERERHVEETEVGQPAVNVKLAAALAAAGGEPVTILSAYRWACAIERIRRANPCRRLGTAEDAIAGSTAAERVVLVIRETWHARLRPLLEVQHFSAHGEAEGYEVWSRLR